jgi:hypothetical protein
MMKKMMARKRRQAPQGMNDVFSFAFRGGDFHAAGI